MTKKRKKHPSQADDASTVWAVACRVGRGEQGEAHGEVDLIIDQGRSRLKSWSTSDSWIAETTGPTYIYIPRYS